ncbi:hypothetical protein [Paenibacillus agilis]|uniref:hypothetical protein n=1 Tax=Paenibacillus agilis TaxID=3020863 RepID=UPI001649F31D|nr:hypothetical protein [Paenibacillus agilis]
MFQYTLVNQPIMYKWFSDVITGCSASAREGDLMRLLPLTGAMEVIFAELPCIEK